MDIFGDILLNYVVVTGIIAWFVAQSLKLLYDCFTTKRFNIWRFIGGAGGMPSSHSALVVAVCVSIYKLEGPSSSVFALALFFAMVVMYDASGVRRAAGEQAKIINDILEHWGDDIEIDQELKELLGHTPVEVLCGAIVGLVVGMVR